MQTETISIITVARNEQDTIRLTIESVLKQNYPYIQYVVWDGESDDATFSVAEGYKQQFEEKGFDFICVRLSDEGIYDAMNRALSYTKGNWIYYLNANDRLYDENVVKDVLSLNLESVDCVYGDTWNEYKKGKLYHKKSYKMDTIYYRAPFIHQALFVRRNVMECYKFDINYEIAADYDLFSKMYQDRLVFKRICRDIAVYNLDGVSQSNNNLRRQEWSDIQKKYGFYKKYKIRRFVKEEIIEKAKAVKLLSVIYHGYCRMRSNR